MNKDLKTEVSHNAIAVPKRVAFIKGREPARVDLDQEEMVMTVPNLVVREMIAFMIMVIVLSVISLTVDAPLEWIANPVHTPNPAKAPWYFLGLQELLHYFPPIVAGVILPTLTALALIAIPYFRVNQKSERLWKNQPRRTMLVLVVVVVLLSAVLALYDVWVMLVPTLLVFGMMLAPYLRPTASGVVGWLGTRSLSWWIMTWFVIVVTVLTAVGTLFRGPEWSWTWPWHHIY